MKKAIVALMAMFFIGSTAQANCYLTDSVGVTRTDTKTWEVCTNNLRYVMSGDHFVPVDSARYDGEGQIRMLELWWTDTVTDEEYQILQCGQCDRVTSLGVVPDIGQQQQSGGGHGLESNPFGVVILVDGLETDIELGETVVGSSFGLRQTTALYAKVSEGPRPVVAAMEFKVDITPLFYEYFSNIEALQDHYVAIEYIGMVSVKGICGGGIFDAVEFVGDAAYNGLGGSANNCEPSESNNFYVGHDIGVLEYSSSIFPVKLRLDDFYPKVYKVQDRVTNTEWLIKAYGQGISAYNNPLFFEKGSKRLQHHTLTFY